VIIKIEQVCYQTKTVEICEPNYATL